MNSSVTSQHPFASLSNQLQAWREACLGSSDLSLVKDDLRGEAHGFFQNLVQNTTIVTENGVVLTTKEPAHEETIAKLLQELEPAFCTRHACRVKALCVLCGAIEGVHSSKVSLTTTKLIGAFLLGHCSPIEIETADDAFGHDELVRDSALICLSALVKCRLVEMEDCHLVESIRIRLEFAMQGLERRCAVAETETEDYHHSQSRGGLSALPRSRRSICFDLVRSAVEGVRLVADKFHLTDKVVAETRDDVAKFVSFAASCMHGESDPRCLVQLLELLRATQVMFAPFFMPPATKAFPARDVFEAVAQYYPVQFTPPPNDIYGITKQSLHEALMSIFCEANVGERSGPDSMLNLTLSIVIERICPPEDDDTSTTTNMDIYEAIQDIHALLFTGVSNNLVYVDESLLQKLSTALFSAHTKTSLDASSPGEVGASAKAAADECRNLVSKIAYHLESNNYEKLWNNFVVDTVRAQPLSNSPQSGQGRASMAFIAALAACGGQRTLRLCLDCCLPSLIVIIQREALDEMKLAAAVYGIAAFLSSARVAIHRANSSSIAFHPHPLRAYSSAVVQGLSVLLEVCIPASQDVRPRKVRSVDVQIAAIRAMESVLLASPQDHFLETDLRWTISFLDYLAEVVIVSSSTSIPHAASTIELGLKRTCCRTLGNLLGRSLHDFEEDSKQGKQISSVVEERTETREHLRTNIFGRLRKSLLVESSSEKDPKYDRMALALACKDSLFVSSKVVGHLVSSLYDAVTKSEMSPSVTLRARTLSFVFRFGGPFATKAFHELTSPSVTAECILDSLCFSFRNDVARVGSSRPNLEAGMSMLKLPATPEQLEEVAKACQQSYELALQIRPAYENSVTIEQLVKLVDRAAQVLPPLEDVDNIKLCVSLPLLAVALTACRRLPYGANINHVSAITDKLIMMAEPLAAYALSLEHNATARSAAAACLSEIIRGCPADQAEPLPSRIIAEIVAPSIQGTLNRLMVSSDDEDLFSKATLRDSLFLLGFLGSTAARVGLKSEAANEAVRFVVEIICVGRSRLPLGVDVVDFNIGGSSVLAPSVIGSAFGSMFSGEDAGPFWKQRLVHVALRHIDFSTGVATLVDHSSGFPQPSPGVLFVNCHIVCSTRIAVLGKRVVKVIAQQILGGLILIGRPSGPFGDYVEVLPLALVSVIKLLCEATDTMSECISLLVLSLSCVLKLVTKHDLIAIQNGIFTFQALATIAQLYRGNKSLEVCKAAVLAVSDEHLSHPSRLLRHAAVQVRNEWSVVGGL